MGTTQTNTSAPISTVHLLANAQKPCPHCDSTGTCKNGPGGTTCDICMARLRGRTWYRMLLIGNREGSPNPTGCWCGVCFGKGFVEGATFKVRYLFPLVFSAAFVVGCFILFFKMHVDLEKLQSSLLTIMGTIVGFYFGGRKDD
jgi:hypothetical protein